MELSLHKGNFARTKYDGIVLIQFVKPDKGHINMLTHPATIERIILLGATKAPVEISEKVGISEFRVRSVLLAHKIPILRKVQKPRPPKQKVLEMIALYRSGKTLREIAKIFRCTHQNVQQCLQWQGEPLRVLGPTAKLHKCGYAECSNQCSIRKKFCSKACRGNHCRENQRPKVFYEKTCIKCGKKFKRSKRLDYLCRYAGCTLTYCSKQCYWQRKA